MPRALFGRQHRVLLLLLLAVVVLLSCWPCIWPPTRARDDSLLQRTANKLHANASEPKQKGKHLSKAASALPDEAKATEDVSAEAAAAAAETEGEHPLSNTASPGSTSAGYASPLPWRAIPSLPPHPGSKPWQVPVLLISAFWDTRPLLIRDRPRVRLVVAWRRDYNTVGIQCAFRYGGDSNTLHVTRFMIAKLYEREEDEAYEYQSAYADCSTAGLPRQPTSNTGSAAGRQQQQLFVTVFKGRQPSRDPRAWASVEAMPVWSQQQLQDHAAGKGPVAVCTPPLHTDAYAASMVSWAEFQQIVGVDRVFVYDFNAGPMTRPTLEFYAGKGLFEVREWIIPRSVMVDPQQRCLLPFFHGSANRERFDSSGCTTHQDNYNVPWWGQTLAIMDCMLRATAKYRWVGVFDFDEYLVPQQPQTLSQLLLAHPRITQPQQQLANISSNNHRTDNSPLQSKQHQHQHQHQRQLLLLYSAVSSSSDTGSTEGSYRLAPQYSFPGRLLCAGCRHHLHELPHTLNPNPRSSLALNPMHHQPSKNAATKLPILHGPRDNVPEACLKPEAGFLHLLWSSVVSTDPDADHWKSIVDPMAVEYPGVHQAVEFNGMFGGEMIHINASQAFKLHDRAHDIHAPSTFMTQMLPLLRQSILPGPRSHTLTSCHHSSSNNQQGSHCHAQQLFPLSDGCASHRYCAATAAKAVDFTVCNVYAEQLMQRVANVTAEMQRVGVFDVWLRLNESQANVYGGHVFEKWAPP